MRHIRTNSLPNKKRELRKQNIRYKLIRKITVNSTKNRKSPNLDRKKLNLIISEKQLLNRQEELKKVPSASNILHTKHTMKSVQTMTNQQPPREDSEPQDQTNFDKGSYFVLKDKEGKIKQEQIKKKIEIEAKLVKTPEGGLKAQRIQSAKTPSIPKNLFYLVNGKIESTKSSSNRFHRGSSSSINFRAPAKRQSSFYITRNSVAVNGQSLVEYYQMKKKSIQQNLVKNAIVPVFTSKNEILAGQRGRLRKGFPCKFILNKHK